MISYYKIIDSQRYDRSLLELAEKLTEGRGDGRISTADARQLFEATRDGGNLITATELRTLRYVLEHYHFSQPAAQWLKTELLGQTPTQRAIRSILTEVFDFSRMKWVIDDEVVEEHSMEFENLTSFPVALREMIEEFLSGTESETSLYRLVAEKFDIDPDNETAIREKIRELLHWGNIYLFPVDWLDQIKSGELHFKYPPFYHEVEDYWPFGLTLPGLPGYHFVGFVNRRDWWDAYHVGYR